MVTGGIDYIMIGNHQQTEEDGKYFMRFKSSLANDWMARPRASIPSWVYNDSREDGKLFNYVCYSVVDDPTGSGRTESTSAGAKDDSNS